MSDGVITNGGGKAGVLICDDSDSVRLLLSVIVAGSSRLWVAGEAADGNEAISEATRLQPSVILLDLAMPKRSGLEALPDLRRVAPDAQIVVFSGFASDTFADEVIALGAATYLEKGAHPDVIVATIEQVLDSLTEPQDARPLAGTLPVGAPRFELGTSSPPDERANQAAPRPVAARSLAVRPRSRTGSRGARGGARSRDGRAP